VLILVFLQASHPLANVVHVLEQGAMKQVLVWQTQTGLSSLGHSVTFLSAGSHCMLPVLVSLMAEAKVENPIKIMHRVRKMRDMARDD